MRPFEKWNFKSMHIRYGTLFFFCNRTHYNNKKCQLTFERLAGATVCDITYSHRTQMCKIAISTKHENTASNDTLKFSYQPGIFKSIANICFCFIRSDGFVAVFTLFHLNKTQNDTHLCAICFGAYLCRPLCVFVFFANDEFKYTWPNR